MRGEKEEKAKEQKMNDKKQKKGRELEDETELLQAGR